MKTFSDLEFQNNLFGIQAILFFHNGYGCSVVREFGTYGNNNGLYELAIIKKSINGFELCYDTKITNDVIGYLTSADVSDIMIKIQNLK